MIQDYAIEVSTDASFVGASPDFLPYVASSKSIQIANLKNTVIDIGAGAELVMEFEITKSFTGSLAANRIPSIIFCVASAGNAALSSNVTILASAMWTLGPSGVEFGMQASDSTVVPSLFKGDRYYAKIPGGVLGAPWIGTTGARNNNVLPGEVYLGAYYILPHRTAQAVQMSNPSLWTATDFTAGEVKTRILINQPVGSNVHHYAAGMAVR
jgi:hypothetical protein